MTLFGRNRVVVILMVGIMIAAGLGAYYYQQTREKEPPIEEEPRKDEEPVDYEPPIIEDLQCKQIKVINDKVYDSALTFKARDESSIISEASVKFIPKIYPHLSSEAFPNESIREFLLEPSDGAFDGNLEGFLVNISDIKGGREYEIQVTVKDNAGNIAESKLTTPYIREFENLGKLLYDKGLIIATTYFVYHPDPIPWIVVSPRDVNPLLGEYDARDRIVIDKHIDWTTGHGINCYFLVWGWDDETYNKIYHDNLLKVISSPLINQIRIAIDYDNSRLWFHGVDVDENYIPYLDDPEKWKGVIEDFKLLNNTFFHKENFLKIKGKSVVYIYGGNALLGKVGDFLDDIRSALDDNIFIFSDHANIDVILQSAYDLGDIEKEFDGWSAWAASWYIDVDEPRNETFPVAVENGYKSWNKITIEYNLQAGDEKVLMPSILPGFVELRDTKRWPKERNLPRDVDMFSKELDIAIKYATPTPIESKKIIRIDTFNDFGEGDAIEPTIEEGFAFLESVKKFALSYLENNK